MRKVSFIHGDGDYRSVDIPDDMNAAGLTPDTVAYIWKAGYEFRKREVAGVAQLVGSVPCTDEVAGSSPATGSTKYRDLWECYLCGEHKPLDITWSEDDKGHCVCGTCMSKKKPNQDMRTCHHCKSRFWGTGGNLICRQCYFEKFKQEKSLAVECQTCGYLFTCNVIGHPEFIACPNCAKEGYGPLFPVAGTQPAPDPAGTAPSSGTTEAGCEKKCPKCGGNNDALLGWGPDDLCTKCAVKSILPISYYAFHNGQMLSHDYLAGFRDGIREVCK